MLQPTLSNRLLKYTAYAIVILSVLVALFAVSSIDDLEFAWRLIIGFAIFTSGAFSALFLFAISEALNRLQEIEYNTERTYQRIEQYHKEQEHKAPM